MGVIFYRNADGKLGTRAFGGASQARTYFVGDITGQALLVTLYDQILKAGVKVYEEWFATSLYMEDGALPRGRRARDDHRRAASPARQGRDRWRRRPRPRLRAEHECAHLHRRRIRAGVSRGRAADGHGDGAIPSHDARRQRFLDDGSRARRGRLSAQRATATVS